MLPRELSVANKIRLQINCLGSTDDERQNKLIWDELVIMTSREVRLKMKLEVETDGHYKVRW